MARRVFSFVFLLLVFGTPAFAEPIKLICEGQTRQHGNGPMEPFSDADLTIDIAKGTVSGSLGSFVLIHSGDPDKDLYFEAPYRKHGQIVGKESGLINRISGRLVWMALYQSNEIAFLSVGLCKRTRGVF
jgi:hypothetical protein